MLAAILRFVDWDVHLLYNPHPATDDALKLAGLDATWDHTLDCWVLPGEQASRLIDVLEAMEYAWELTDNPELTWCDELFAGVPEQMRDRVFLGLAVVLHPANGGDVTMFTQLYRSWRTFR